MSKLFQRLHLLWWLVSVSPHSAIGSFWSIIRWNFSHQNRPKVKELLQEETMDIRYVSNVWQLKTSRLSLSTGPHVGRNKCLINIYKSHQKYSWTNSSSFTDVHCIICWEQSGKMESFSSKFSAPFGTGSTIWPWVWTLSCTCPGTQQ